MKNKIIGLIIGELILFAAIIGAETLAFANGAAGGVTMHFLTLIHL